MHRPAHIILLAALFAASCSKRDDAAPRAVVAREPVTVTVATVERVPMERTVREPGTLQAIDRATLSIKTTGRLRTLRVDVGSLVKAGDVLAEIEPRDYELRLQQALAALSQARARLGLPIEGTDDTVDHEKVSVVREAKALFEEAQKNLERVKRLQAEKISSDAEFERASAEHQVTLNRLTDALQDVRERQALLAQRRAEFEIARQQLADISLRAPFDGVVQARLTNVGEFLAAGSAVVNLVRMDPLRLRLEIPERKSAQIRVGQPVRMTLEGDTNVYRGQLSRVSPAMDERNRLLVVEAEFRNPGHLRPGAFARADIVVAEAVPALAIPADAVTAFAGTEKAFVVVTNTVTEKRLQTGRANETWVEVLSGLKPGDVVVRNPGGLQSGDRVRVAEEVAGHSP